MIITLTAAAVVATAAPAAASPQDSFHTALHSLCGKSFAGRMATSDAADADMAGKSLTMTVTCPGGAVRIPFAVGEDHSRTWVITRTADGLRLKHDHRHADGTPDEITNYGGETATAGSATRQEFPVDGESIALFTRTGRTVSNTNVWALDLVPGALFAYELRRENRHFRVEFDLSRPIIAD